MDGSAAESLQMGGQSLPTQTSPWPSPGLAGRCPLPSFILDTTACPVRLSLSFLDLKNLSF